MWFAELAHIKEYGRTISGDSYIKMEYGPVPSFLYDVLKGIRDGNPLYEKYSKLVAVNEYKIHPLMPPDTDYLSVSDINELDKSIEENKNLSMGQLTDKSHGVAWLKSKDNKKIYIENMLDELGIEGKKRTEIIENYRFAQAFAEYAA
jgi:hypothetical protein